MEETKVVFLRGKKVVLRPLSKKDIPLLNKWINDPEVRCFVGNNNPFTLEAQEDWYSRVTKDSKKIVLVIETLEGQTIGTMGLHDINWIDRRAYSGSLIGEKDFWGKGYGQDAKMTLLNYAFNTLGLRKICSDALIYNKRSIGHNQKCGYKLLCIKKKHYFKKGRFHDAAYLEITKKDWLPNWRRYKSSR